MVGLDHAGGEELDEAPIIEDVEDDQNEVQDVSDPEKTPPPMPYVTQREAIDCPTKNCMHRKDTEDGEGGIIHVVMLYCVI